MFKAPSVHSVVKKSDSKYLDKFNFIAYSFFSHLQGHKMTVTSFSFSISPWLRAYNLTPHISSNIQFQRSELNIIFGCLGVAGTLMAILSLNIFPHVSKDEYNSEKVKALCCLIIGGIACAVLRNHKTNLTLQNERKCHLLLSAYQPYEIVKSSDLAAILESNSSLAHKFVPLMNVYQVTNVMKASSKLQTLFMTSKESLGRISNREYEQRAFEERLFKKINASLQDLKNLSNLLHECKRVLGQSFDDVMSELLKLKITIDNVIEMNEFADNKYYPLAPLQESCKLFYRTHRQQIEEIKFFKG